MSKFGTSNEIAPPGINFIIQNITTHNISVFGNKISPGLQYDLFTSPDISEDDIKTSLLKGELKAKLNQITIVFTNLELVINDPVYRGVLISKGLPVSSITDSSGQSVSNLATLSLITNPGTVAIAEVQTNLGLYIFSPTSTTTADGYIVVAPPTGIGRWFRQMSGHRFWQNQLNYFVDPVSGNDENTGLDSSHPVKTIKELSYRLGDHIIRGITVNLLNDLPSTDSLGQLVFRGVVDSSITGGQPQINVVGQMVTTRTGTFSAATSQVPASNLAASASDTSVSDWTSDVGNMIVVTSGAVVGSFAWVLKDLGSNTARLTQWTLSSFMGNSAAPSASDTYKIVTLTAVPSSVPELLGQTKVGAAEQVLLTNISFAAALQITRDTENQHNFRGCKIAGLFTVSGGRVEVAGCLSNTITATGPDSWLRMDQSGILSSSATVFSSGAGFNFVNVVVQGSGGLQLVNNANGLITTSLGIFDSTGTGLIVGQGSYLDVSTALFGSGNLVGTDVRRNGRLRLAGGITPTLTGTTELNFESTTTAISPLVSGATVPAAASISTWAAWAAAPFSKFVVSYKTGSTIFGV